MADEVKEFETPTGTEDYAQAEWLAQRLRKKWRYDHTAERWHRWDGVRWAVDDTHKINAAVARLAGAVLGKGGMGTASKRMTELLKWPVQERVLKALATLDGYGTNGDDWDQKPTLLGCANGIVDLTQNALVETPGPELNVTRSTKVDFEPVAGPAEFVARAPNFMRLMGEWMSGDATMVSFLLLWYGASLFGFTPEQRFLLLIGSGRNGKGTLKNALLHALGEYAAQLDANLYMRNKYGAARSDQARADLLKLKGLRLAFFSEPSGGRFDEELLKAHTGGDQIMARALYSNNLQTWEPTHSITFLTNEAPEVDDLGPSMSERVMVADFRERYEGRDANKKLDEVLRKEAKGILAILCWAAKAWHDDWNSGGQGITMPERVVQQSRAFMERNDQIANWLNERGTRDKTATTPSQAAFDSYLDWFKGNGESEDPWSQVRFALELQKKGFVKTRNASFRGWQGFRLLGAVALADKGVGDDEDE